MGHEAIEAFLRTSRQLELVPTRANGQPAFACYLSRPGGSTAYSSGVLVLVISGDRISSITRFLDTEQQRPLPLQCDRGPSRCRIPLRQGQPLCRSPFAVRHTVLMSRYGTDAYRGLVDLPPLVEAAAKAALETGFEPSSLPSQGRLLQLLAGGIDAGVIGETGTGCGVGLAWLASGAREGVRLVSIERDEKLVDLARLVFAGVPAVTVLHGDWRELRGAGPFELLALDGGGQGKADEPAIEPEEWLRPGGMVVVDDFTPGAGWPPVYNGRPDLARLRWLQHPRLLATEVRIQPDSSTILATFTS